MSHLPTKAHWDVVQRRADVYYSLRRAYNKFLIDKSKLINQERKENERRREKYSYFRRANQDYK